MAISDELLDKARRGHPGAAEEVLAEAYPAVFRMAYALTGRPGAARQVLHDVLRRSLRVMPHWRRGMVPENWFYHHTIITARSASPQPPPPQDDVLLKQARSDNPAYAAFLRAVRSLPRQQTEAFILHHGEKLNTRLLGVAMDCSQNAAADHLRAAEQSVSAVTGEATPVLIATMEQAYSTLAPPVTAVRPAARKYVARHLRPRRIKRIALLILLLALLAALFYLWQSRDLIRLFFFPPADNPATAPAA